MVPKVLYMSFDRFLIAVESRDLSQADKILIRESSFLKLSDEYIWMIRFAVMPKKGYSISSLFHYLLGFVAQKVWSGEGTYRLRSSFLVYQRHMQKTVSVEMVFCYQNCSDLLWKKIVLVNEKNVWNLRLKAKNLQNFEITRIIYSNSERAEQFLVT